MRTRVPSEAKRSIRTTCVKVETFPIVKFVTVLSPSVTAGKINALSEGTVFDGTTGTGRGGSVNVPVLNVPVFPKVEVVVGAIVVGIHAIVVGRF